MKNDMISPNKLRRNNETSFEQKTQVPTDDAAVPEAQNKSVEEGKVSQGTEPVVDTMLRSDIREEEVLLEKSPIEANITREEEVAN